MNCRTFARPFVGHAALAASCVWTVLVVSVTTASSAAVAVEQGKTSVLDFSAGTTGQQSGWTVTASGPTSLKLSFGLSSLKVSEVRAAEQRWHRLGIDDATWHGAVGEPELPMVSRLVAVPPGMSLAVKQVTATATVVPNLRLFPAQELWE